MNRIIRKTTALMLLLALLLSPVRALAFEGISADPYYQLTGSQPPSEVPVSAEAALTLDARAVLLGDAATGEILYKEAASEPMPIASITKVMTMLLIMEALDSGRITLEDEVTASEHAYSMGGSQIWLEPGEVMTVHELLKAVAVASANDAAVALAEHVSGSEDAFVAEMNRKAASLGMHNTCFKNSNGLDEEGHLSTAEDVFIMSRELLRHELVREYVSIWMDELRGGETQLVNTNKLLTSYSGITGLKTGSTSKAGICISASAERDGMELIAVVLGSPDSKSRFAAARTLLDHGFASYELAELSVPEDTAREVGVKLGKEESCGWVCELPEVALVKKGMKDSVRVEITAAESVTAPVEEGQVLGEATVYVAGELKGSYPILAERAVEKMDFLTAIERLFYTLCSAAV